MASLAALFVVIYAINVIPAFAPPTWMVMTLLGLHFGKTSVLPMPLVGATAATLGRFTLAKLARAIIRQRVLSESTRQNIEVLKTELERKPALTVGTFLLYALTPLPSNCLFIAYGLTPLPLRLITLPFFAGRLASYSFFFFSASYARSRLMLEGTEVESYLSLYFVLTQITLLILVYVFAKIDWRALIEQRSLRWFRSNDRIGAV